MAKFVFFIVGLLIGCGIGWLAGSLSSTFTTVSNDPNSGRFLAPPETRWSGDGRDMILLKDFVFIDSRGKSWLAEKDTIVNGASIPRMLWTMTGGPLTGRFRNASIVHDAECERMTSPSTDVHRMFYDACRAGGVEERDAKYLYWAVANYGPTWQTRSVSTVAATAPPVGAGLKSTPPNTTTIRLDARQPTEKELEWAEEYFKQENPSIDKVPLLTPPDDNQPAVNHGV